MSDADRRSGPRIPVEMWVEEASQDDLYFQRSANISVGGIYLEGTVPHPAGTIVTLSFTLPGDQHRTTVRGEIVNVQERDHLGMGIRFVDLDDAALERIEGFIVRRQQQLAARVG